jgi:hypothetical protein
MSPPPSPSGGSRPPPPRESLSLSFPPSLASARLISWSRGLGFALLFLGLLIAVVGVLPPNAPYPADANFVGKLLAVLGLGGILLAGGLSLEFSVPLRPGADQGEYEFASTRLKVDAAMALGAAALMVWLLTTL